MSTELEAKIREIIASAKDDIDMSQLGVESPLEESGLDSMDIASILIGVQEEFDIKIPDSDVDSLVSIKSIVDYVASRTAAARP
jgi:acyl carrier protein